MGCRDGSAVEAAAKDEGATGNSGNVQKDDHTREKDLESELSQSPESTDEDPIPPPRTRKRKPIDTSSEASSADTSDTNDDDEGPDDARNNADWSTHKRYQAFLLMEYDDIRTLATEYYPTSLSLVVTLASKELVQDQRIEQIIRVLIGLEGMPVDYDSLQEHNIFFKNIDIILLIVEERI